MSEEADKGFNWFSWHQVLPDVPRMGEKVLVWDQTYGTVVAIRWDEGFFDALGVLEKLGEVEWWLPLPPALPRGSPSGPLGEPSTQGRSPIAS
ncbi:MAG: hypothetical protein ABR568_10525 [Pyrinomonadaceae bacterium]